jgi:hypothetical protein
MRRLFAATGFTDLPKSANSIKTLVSEHGQVVRCYVMTELAERKTKGQKFSITFDEWTSNRNRRYMIINVHEQGPMFWSLGLSYGFLVPCQLRDVSNYWKRSWPRSV